MHSDVADNSDRPAGLSGKQAARATAAIFAVAVGAWIARFYMLHDSPAPPAQEPPAVVVAPSPQLSPIEKAALRAKAWALIEPRLDEADRASRAALDEQLAGIDDFFRARQAGVRPFAEEVLSLGGKWEYAKSTLPTAEADAHARYLNEKFETYLFRIDDLKQTLEQAIGGYVSRVQGLESKLLVDVRADLSDKQFAAAGLPTVLVSDEAFRAEFARLLQETAAATSADFRVSMSREVTSFVAGEVAAVVAVRIASAVATRLGISAGVLSTGAASSWATFGLALAAAVVVDVAISQIISLAGYDPVDAVAEKVQAALNQIRSLLVDGNPEALAAYEKLRRMQSDDSDGNVRAACRRAADSIEGSGNLGLRRELLKLHDERARLRRATLQRFVLEPATEA